MTTARKVIEWDGRDADPLLREVRALPPGHYVLVPANELAVLEAGESDLTSEEVAALNDGIDQADRGELVDAAEVFADLDVRIADAEAARRR